MDGLRAIPGLGGSMMDHIQDELRERWRQERACDIAPTICQKLKIAFTGAQAWSAHLMFDQLFKAKVSLTRWSCSWE